MRTVVSDGALDYRSILPPAADGPADGVRIKVKSKGKPTVERTIIAPPSSRIDVNIRGGDFEINDRPREKREYRGELPSSHNHNQTRLHDKHGRNKSSKSSNSNKGKSKTDQGNDDFQQHDKHRKHKRPHYVGDEGAETESFLANEMLNHRDVYQRHMFNTSIDGLLSPHRGRRRISTTNRDEITLDQSLAGGRRHYIKAAGRWSGMPVFHLDPPVPLRPRSHDLLEYLNYTPRGSRRRTRSGARSGDSAGSTPRIKIKIRTYAVTK